MLLLHSKSIIISSEHIDSHGDNVSRESERAITDCRGFACGAYELLVDMILCSDLVESMSVGVPPIECMCWLMLLVSAKYHK